MTKSRSLPAKSPSRVSPSGAKTARVPVHKRPPGEIRLIGGHWKRIKLKVADKPGLRPTPDRVRETLFNWLGQDLSGLRCVDVFAGTGALGFEAASRGAAEVLLVEREGVLVEQLQRVCSQLQALEMTPPVAPQRLLIQRGEGLAALRQLAPASQHVIFLDPPFDSDLYEAALTAAARAIAPQGWVYLEAPKAWTEAVLNPLGWTVHRHLKAGAVHAHLLRAVGVCAADV
ncbi:MAG: 16S rRNA (guanine(966)-N(2))-methyltransferase RsmD [Burkholderiales bacterium]|nr:16S rRNA (guanine(966)-N(2))-methyltransferase RsmD [Burkholderiales bacterium]